MLDVVEFCNRRVKGPSLASIHLVKPMEVFEWSRCVVKVEVF